MKYKIFPQKTDSRFSRQAFTVVELLIVVVVIGILAQLTIVGYSSVSSRAVAAALQSDLVSTKKQLMVYQVQNGTFPTAINCPTPGATEICVRPSGSDSFSYTVNNATNPPTFSLTATNGTTAYLITDSSNYAVSAPLAVSGGTLASDATYYYRTFASSGTLTVSNGNLTADVLVIAGGGGGGANFGSGGGAGGVSTVNATFTGAIAVTVGAGGNPQSSDTLADATNGGSSSFGSYLTTTGGGHGGGGQGGSTPTAGGSGAGGEPGNATPWAGVAGQGNNGGLGNSTYGPSYGSGGGGGAGAVGGNGGVNGGVGGAGTNAYSTWLSAINSTMIAGWQTATATGYIAGGGGGGSNGGGGAAGGAGGVGGGGSSTTGGARGIGYPGVANTGGGGGGSNEGYNGPGTTLTGGAGGSGIVIVRYTRAQVGG